MLKQVFTLSEIACWTETNEVDLPNVQRGFVWKPSQIENLWDSLLRGYPVGAFVLTPKKDKGKSFEILDGQQRATAICLGFNKATFRNTQYKVFIDLEKPPIKDSREYYFRVITPSHPWGYQKVDNTKTLDAKSKRNAMSVFSVNCNVNNPFEEGVVNKVYPIDSELPIPFEIFINSVIQELTSQQLQSLVLKWLKSSGVYNDWIQRTEKTMKLLVENYKGKKRVPQIVSLEQINVRVDEVFEKVKLMLDKDFGQKIPALYLDISEIYNQKAIPLNAVQDSVVVDDENGIDDNEIDPVENLFVRLNAGGTPLRGEELNYSILKANIDKQLQELIEESCKGYIKPSRFISIAFRLFQHQDKYEERDGLSLKIRPKQFQTTINSKKHKTSFFKFINSILSQKNFEGLTLLEYSKKVLTYDEKCYLGLPYLTVSTIAEKSPEIMFLLLYRIQNKGDRFPLSSKLHKKMLGVLTCLMWFGKSEKQRNYSKLLRNVWAGAENLKLNLFWSSITIQRAMLDETSFIKLPTKLELKRVEKTFTEGITKRTQVWDRINNVRLYKELMYNKDIILYSQRDFLSKLIKTEQLSLDDTDVPFDWDHISPNSFISGKQSIPQILRDFYSSNGNFRAWPYSLNRTDQDVSPDYKFDPLNFTFYDGNIEQYKKVKNIWSQFISENKHLRVTPKNLKQALLDWSVCDRTWTKFKIENENIRVEWKLVYTLILKRNFQLIDHWYSTLLINELLPQKQSARFNEILNNKFWSDSFFNNSFSKESIKYLKVEFDYAERNVWLSKAISLHNTDFHFYIDFDKNPLRMIKDYNIGFGIIKSYECKSDSFFEIPEVEKNQYQSNDFTWVQGVFTLSSHEIDSYVQLIKEFRDWLVNFPVKKLQNDLKDEFTKLIRLSFAPKD